MTNDVRSIGALVVAVMKEQKSRVVPPALVAEQEAKYRREATPMIEALRKFERQGQADVESLLLR